MEESLYVNDAFLSHYHKPARARLRGLARNPRIPADLLVALLDDQRSEVASAVEGRQEWTDEQVGALAGHPDTEVRVLLARSRGLTPDQRATLVEGSSGPVRLALALGPDHFSFWTFSTREWLPVWACDRLLERNPRLKQAMEDNHHLPREFRDRLFPPSEPAPPQDAGPLTREEAEALTHDDDEWTRQRAAADPRLPAELVADLSADPSPSVRLAVSMRPELTERERAAIDYRVGRDDRLRPLGWVTAATDPGLIRRCVRSAHVGLRRSAAVNPHLPPELIAVLAADDDFAVRLLLCENHDDVPSDTVLTTYLEGTTMTAGRLLQHPALVKEGLARLAGSPDPRTRALAVLDPQAPPELIERLSHDPEPVVRRWSANDPRLSPPRVLELFDDPVTIEPAAANPHLPEPVMRRILREAGGLADEVVEGTPTMYLGNWSAGG